MEAVKLHSVPYHDPETIRNAALRFITQVEEGIHFPLLATGTIILGPEPIALHDTWAECFEEQIQKMVISVLALLGGGPLIYLRN